MYINVDVVHVTSTPTYQYTNSASKHAILCKSVNITSNGSISPAQQLLHLILQPLNLTSSAASWQWFC